MFNFQFPIRNSSLPPWPPCPCKCPSPVPSVAQCFCSHTVWQGTCYRRGVHSCYVVKQRFATKIRMKERSETHGEVRPAGLPPRLSRTSLTDVFSALAVLQVIVVFSLVACLSCRYSRLSAKQNSSNRHSEATGKVFWPVAWAFSGVPINGESPSIDPASTNPLGTGWLRVCSV